jgi:DNA-binding GntR family transcriptional regulator
MATMPRKPQGLDEWAPSLLKARVYSRILVDILTGALKPGEQLDENILARRYGGGLGGGLAGVRDALARLALEGLVLRMARVGTTVAPLDLAGARDAFEARRLVEIHCAGLAATHANAEQVAAIRATLTDGEAAVEAGNTSALAAMDEAFHVAVAAAGGNRTLAKMVVTLHHQTARHWLIGAAPSRGESLTALAEHRALAEAIAAHDPVRARALMERTLGDFPSDAKPQA